MRPWINESGTYLVLHKYLQNFEWLNGKKASILEAQNRQGLLLAGVAGRLTFKFDLNSGQGFLSDNMKSVPGQGRKGGTSKD